MNIKHLLVSFFSVFVIIIFSNSILANIDTKTVCGLWLFDDEGENIERDLSGNGNDGTIHGKPKWAQGKFGKAIDFDGVDDYVEYGDKETLNMGTSDFSIVAWIKCAKYIPPDWEGQIVSKLYELAPRHGYLLGVRGALDAANVAKPIFRIGLGTDVSVHLFGTSPINDDIWHHLAVTVNRRGLAILYRDGKVESQISIADKVNENEDNDQPFRIGRHQQHAGFFQGAIDEVAIFKTVLTLDDINKIMTKGLMATLTSVSPMDKSTISWWRVKSQYDK